MGDYTKEFKSKRPPPAIIDRRGFVLRKKCVSKELEALIQDELIVKPELNNEFKESEYFKVYTEDDDNYYLPKFWAEENIGIQPIINFKINVSYCDIIKSWPYFN
jgi:hypothetical protein